MYDMSAFDWQSFKINKDVTDILKLTKKREDRFFPTIMFAFVPIFESSRLMLSRDLDFIVQCIFPLLWFTWVISAIIIAYNIIVSFLNLASHFLRKISRSTKVLSINDQIDTFDNEVCYYIMLSRFFQSQACSEKDENVKKFYIIELFFYTEKSIYKIYNMLGRLGDIFSEQNKENDTGSSINSKWSIFKLFIQKDYKPKVNTYRFFNCICIIIDTMESIRVDGDSVIIPQQKIRETERMIRDIIDGVNKYNSTWGWQLNNMIPDGFYKNRKEYTRTE